MSQGCLVIDKKGFLVKFQNICVESAKLGIIKGSDNLKHSILELIETAKTSPDPKGQLSLLRESLEDFYGAPNAFARFAEKLFPIGSVLTLFNDNYDTLLAEKAIPADTGMAEASITLRQRNFIDSKFKKASNAKLYFAKC